MPRSIRSSISKRIKFHDRPDLFNGKYFYITAPYGLFYLLGGIIGYNITYNLFCLLISCSIGILFIILSIAHAIDYYNKAPIASFYVSLPFVISLFVAILMTCFWGLGSRFKSSAIVACVAWPAWVFYFYAILKDYPDGSEVRSHTWKSLPDNDNSSSNSSNSIRGGRGYRNHDIDDDGVYSTSSDARL